MPLNTTVPSAKIVNSPTKSSKLSTFEHFPQPVFLFSSDMQLIEMTPLGEIAVNKHWIGISANKIHFNSRANDLIVKRAIERLCAGSDDNTESCTLSERLILRTVDMVYRAYTLSRESCYSNNLLLIVQDDLTCTDHKIETLARAFGLSGCESRIIKMMVNGMKPKEIAYEAGISLNTVRSHLRTLYAKMQVRDYNDALTQAVRLLV